MISIVRNKEVKTSIMTGCAELNSPTILDLTTGDLARGK